MYRMDLLTDVALLLMTQTKKTSLLDFSCWILENMQSFIRNRCKLIKNMGALTCQFLQRNVCQGACPLAYTSLQVWVPMFLITSLQPILMKPHRFHQFCMINWTMEVVFRLLKKYVKLLTLRDISKVRRDRCKFATYWGVQSHLKFSKIQNGSQLPYRILVKLIWSCQRYMSFTNPSSTWS